MLERVKRKKDKSGDSAMINGKRTRAEGEGGD